MSLDWTHEEVAATVAAYLRMLTMELTGQAYNKSEHRRALHQLLPGRSEGAIEFKHGNISVVMIELGYPYIRGYRDLCQELAAALTYWCQSTNVRLA